MASWISRNIWICLTLAIALAAVVLAVFGVTWTTAIIVAIMLICPAVIVWGAVTLRRPKPMR